jgi:predicted secreted hydrolase
MARLRNGCLAVVVMLLAGLPAGADDADGWSRVTGPPELELPRDHGAHSDFRTEWWYVTGLVRDESGRRYGFQITFFRNGLAPGAVSDEGSALRARQIVAAHLAVADVDSGRFHHAERLRRAGLGLAGFSETGLEVWLDDWRMSQSEDGRISMEAFDPRGFGLDLVLKPEKPLVRHGVEGYSQKGAEPGNASVYLSWTRLAVAGELEVEGRRLAVEGGAWFDHEWGTSTLGEGVEGWDWISLRLDDGRDLMVFRLRLADGSFDPRSAGTLVEADGRAVPMARDDFELEEVDWWSSPATGGRYPVRWRLRVPLAGIDVEVRSLLEASELDSSATTGVVYWEGPIESEGSHRGEGYLEMTGYAGTMEGRF